MQNYGYGITLKQGNNLPFLTPEQIKDIPDNAIVAVMCRRDESEDDSKRLWASAGTIREAISFLKAFADAKYGPIDDEDWQGVRFELTLFDAQGKVKDIAPCPVYWSYRDLRYMPESYGYSPDHWCASWELWKKII